MMIMHRCCAGDAAYLTLSPYQCQPKKKMDTKLKTKVNINNFLGMRLKINDFLIQYKRLQFFKETNLSWTKQVQQNIL